MMSRVPPQNIDAEQILLGTILLTGKIPENFSPDLFYKDSHRLIFSAMLALSIEGGIDITTVSNYLRNQNKMEQIGGVIYLVNLTNIVPSVSNIHKYAEIVREKAVLRKIIAVSSEAAQISYEEQGDIPVILAQLQRQLYEIQSMLGVLGSEEMDLDLDTLLEGFCVKETHLECLNNAVGGLPSDVTVVGGAISMGKTSLTLGFLSKFAIKDGQRVAYFGSGVKKDEIYLRLLCFMSGIESKVLQRGGVNQEQRKILAAHHKVINAAPISIFTMSEKMSVIDIVSKTRALVEEYGKDEMGAIIIENLQQLVWPESIKTRKGELDLIFSCLKSLALDLDIPVIISSQVDRNISLREDKRPKPTDVVGTGDIEALSRLVLLLYWDDYYHPERNSRDEDGFVPAEIIIYKTGKPVTLNLKFNPLTFQWKDAEN
ncbi:MAG: Primary replicative DNA helicase [Candidatus Moranbacteria bacterium GW2011_GWF2_34_56]|nr:MAG: Primary replicative DNA helicase [Candidatus Moranbacteria bacterium GW2011_GWF2_34_56]